MQYIPITDYPMFFLGYALNKIKYLDQDKKGADAQGEVMEGWIRF